MLRVLSLLAAPVLDPQNPETLDLRQEWEKLSAAVRQSGAPILLARLTPPTLGALRTALSPRAEIGKYLSRKIGRQPSVSEPPGA